MVSVALRTKLEALTVARPVVTLANRRRTTVAVKPSLVARVEYRTITTDGQLRHASFKRLA
jgi:ATP-dependent DNA ligase